MSIIVTPQPDHIPPRVRIDIDSDDPSKSFTSLTVYRDGKPIREQPYSGGSEAVAFDYESPFGVPVTYSAAGEVSSATATVYSTAWANLTGWTVYAGPAAVAGGRLTSGGVQRTVALTASGSLTIDAPFGSPPAPLMFVGDAAVIRKVSASTYSVQVGSLVQNIAWTSGALVMQWTPSSTVVATPQATKVFDTPWLMTGDQVGAEVLLGAGSVGGFTLRSMGTPAPFAATATATLDVSEAWLIHPSQPSLSCAIDAGPQGAHNLRFIEASSGETKSSEAQRTIHRGIGSRRAVVITSGPRTADEWTLILGAPTIQQKNAVRAIVDDQTPLLLRIPPSAQYDLPDDWYSVGDLTVTRLETPNITEETSITLPLTPVDEPIVRQGPLWTYGSDLLLNATYADSRAAFPSYLDRLAGAS